MILSEAYKFKKSWKSAQLKKVESFYENDYFVYLHVEKNTDLPMYVGIGFRPNRPWDVTDRNVLHKNKIKKHGVRVEIVADGLPQESAFFWEVAWIKALRAAGYSLANLVDGGSCPRGYRHTEQALQKLSASNAGENNRMYGRRGEENPNFGRKNTADTIARMQKSQKGRVISQEAREKLRQINSGKKHSDSSKQKMSESHKIRWELSLKERVKEPKKLKTPEERSQAVKMSWERRSRVASLETRQKMSATRKNIGQPDYLKEAAIKANMGNKYALGRKQSQEEKNKRSVIMKDIWRKRNLIKKGEP